MRDATSDDINSPEVIEIVTRVLPYGQNQKRALFKPQAE